MPHFLFLSFHIVSTRNSGRIYEIYRRKHYKDKIFSQIWNFEKKTSRFSSFLIIFCARWKSVHFIFAHFVYRSTVTCCNEIRRILSFVANHYDYIYLYIIACKWTETLDFDGISKQYFELAAVNNLPVNDCIASDSFAFFF